MPFPGALCSAAFIVNSALCFMVYSGDLSIAFSFFLPLRVTSSEFSTDPMKAFHLGVHEIADLKPLGKGKGLARKKWHIHGNIN